MAYFGGSFRISSFSNAAGSWIVQKQYCCYWWFVLAKTIYLPRIFIQIILTQNKSNWITETWKTWLEKALELWKLYEALTKPLSTSMISSFHRTIYFHDLQPPQFSWCSVRLWHQCPPTPLQRLNGHLGFLTPLPWWSAGMVSSNSKSRMAGSKSAIDVFWGIRDEICLPSNHIESYTVLEVLFFYLSDECMVS